MSLARCSKGHFFDNNKFDSCPHCKQINRQKQDETEAIFVGNPSKNKQEEKVIEVKVDIPEKPLAPKEELTSEAAEPIAQSVKLTDQVAEVVKSKPPVSAPVEEMMDDDVTVRFSYHNQPQEEPGNEPSFTKERIDPVVGWLVCVKGMDYGKSFIIKSGRNFVGRDESMDIVIPRDKSISRNCHAVIAYDPRANNFFVAPGESKELFYLDNELVLMPKKIEDYQILSLGETDLMFVSLCNEKFTWK